MLQYQTFSASVITEGLENEVHQEFLDLSGPHPIVRGWIASEAGKKFSIVWGTSAVEFPVEGVISIDGIEQSCDYVVIMDAEIPRIELPCARSEDKIRDFIFSPVQVADDDIYNHTLGHTYRFGSISIELWKVRVTKIVNKQYQHQKFDPTSVLPDIIHEKSKQSGMHRVHSNDWLWRFGQECMAPNSDPETVIFRRVGKKPLVAFEFLYRPIEILIANGIVTRPHPPPDYNTTSRRASPPANEEIADEIQQLEARLRVLRRRLTEGQPTRRKHEVKRENRS